MNALAAITRSWPMLGALGAGLVLTALAAGAGGAPQVVLAGLGVAALGWGALSLHAGRLLAPRSVLAVCVLSLSAAGAAVAAGAMADVAGLPLVAASAFAVVVALSAAFDVRRGRAAHDEPRLRHRPRYRRTPADLGVTAPAASTTAARPRGAVDGRASLLGLVGGAALVAALATPALAATDAGRLAVPHGQHGTPGTVAPLQGTHDSGHSH